MRSDLFNNLRRFLWRGIVVCAVLVAWHQSAPALRGGVLPTADGFYGIWYSISQPGEYLYKYSGGLGTYPQQTSPLAIYAEDVNRTYFAYGGTDGTNNVLKNYISYFDHDTGLVARPREVRHVGGSDVHKNATLTIDDDGYLYVFGNSHGNSGSGNLYKSADPFSITAFDEISLPSEFNNNAGSPKLAYSNPFYVSGSGFMSVYNDYDDGRAAHVATSPDGVNWTDQTLFDTNQGHYTVARQNGDTVGVIANYHNGGLNNRTNLYYFQTSDFGQTWTNAGGNALTTPLTSSNNPALVHNYLAENKLVYMKDVDYDAAGNPILLYLTVSDETGSGHLSGPQPGGRTLHTAQWTGSDWQIRDAFMTDHNYDHGELVVEPDGTWRITGPYIDGPQQYGTGGEVGVWVSQDEGANWQFVDQLTNGSQFNHTFVRTPVNAHDDFSAYWADGNAFGQSASRLYFSDEAGNVYRMPTNFSGDFAAPELVTNDPPPPLPGALLAYDGFDYPNSGSSLLAGKNGGAGWAGPWVFSGAAATANAGFDVSQDDTSLDSAAFPFAPTGNRVLAAGQGGTNTYRADRAMANTFDLGAEGDVLYVSLLFHKDGSTTVGTSGNNMELDLTPGGIRLGSTSGNQFFLNDGDNTFGSVTLGETYFLVLKLESHAEGNDLASAMVFSSDDTVPTSEPTTWDGTHSFDSDGVIELVRLWIGSNASGQFDEIRLGTSWLSVTAIPVPGDFDGDGDVDGADFVVWQTNFPTESSATLATGDADGDGDVDGADFVIWQTNFPFTPSSASTPAPEPTGILLAALGVLGFSTFRQRFTSVFLHLCLIGERP